MPPDVVPPVRAASLGFEVLPRDTKESMDTIVRSFEISKNDRRMEKLLSSDPSSVK